MGQDNSEQLERFDADFHETLPGKLGGSIVEFDVHTIEAASLVTGRHAPDKARIIGLDEFNKRASIVYAAAAQGDPFAMDALVRLEQAIKNTEATLHQLDKDVQELMQGKVRISQGVSRKPITYQVQLAHYGSQVTDSIVEYDQQVMGLRNAMFHNRIGVIEGKAKIEQGRRSLRRALTVLRDWRYTGVRCRDLSQLNQRAQETIMKLVQSRFLDLSEYEGDWGKAANYYAGAPYLPNFGPQPQNDGALNTLEQGS